MALKSKHCILNAGSRPNLSSTLALRVNHLECGQERGGEERKGDKTEEHNIAKIFTEQTSAETPGGFQLKAGMQTGGGSMDLRSERQNRPRPPGPSVREAGPAPL